MSCRCPDQSARVRRQSFMATDRLRSRPRQAMTDLCVDTSTSAKKMKLQDPASILQAPFQQSADLWMFHFLLIWCVVSLASIAIILVTRQWQRHLLASSLEFRCCVCGESELFKTSSSSQTQGTPDVSIRFGVAVTSNWSPLQARTKVPCQHEHAAWPKLEVVDNSDDKGACCYKSCCRKLHEKGREGGTESFSKTAVSCDGTWQKRGFSNKHGICTVLSSHPDLTAKV